MEALAAARDAAVQMNDTPVVGLWEAGTLWVEDGRITLPFTLPRQAVSLVRVTW